MKLVRISKRHPCEVASRDLNRLFSPGEGFSVHVSGGRHSKIIGQIALHLTGNISLTTFAQRQITLVMVAVGLRDSVSSILTIADL